MRFALSQDQLLARDTLRELLARDCSAARVREAWSQPTGRVTGLWARLAELGIAGATVPEAHGGLGLAELDLVLLLEEAGRAALPEPLLETTAVGVPLLVEAGTEPLRAAWLPRVVAGDATLTVGLGESPFVAFADAADLLLLRSGDELHAVPRADVQLAAETSVDGARRLASVSWAPSPRTLMASGATAARASARAFDRGALATAAQLLGVGRHLLDVTVEYCKVRHQFGKPVGSFQAVKHHLADALLRLELARPATLRAAHSMAHDAADQSLHVSMAKALAGDAARFAAHVALQCHGAIGYTVEYDLHLWMKRAWALSAAWGDPAWHRERVGAVVLDGNSGAVTAQIGAD